MSRRTLLHAALDRRIDIQHTGSNHRPVRVAVPGEASAYRAEHRIIRPRRRPQMVITTGKKADPNDPKWLTTHAANTKEFRITSGRSTRALRHLKHLRSAGASHAKLWQQSPTNPNLYIRLA